MTDEELIDQLMRSEAELAAENARLLARVALEQQAHQAALESMLQTLAALLRRLEWARSQGSVEDLDEIIAMVRAALVDAKAHPRRSP